jgi:hypothetical protein
MKIEIVAAYITRLIDFLKEKEFCSLEVKHHIQKLFRPLGSLKSCGEIYYHVSEQISN